MDQLTSIIDQIGRFGVKRLNGAWFRYISDDTFVSAEMKAAVIVLTFVSLIGAMQAVFGAEFEGKVVRVLDGDTVEVLHEGSPERIRLNGIDCPEKSQAFGQRAKQFTSSLCFGKVVRVEDHGKDRYGRTIGEVFADGKDVNRELVRAGLAWWYRKYAPNDAELKRLEQEAKEAKRGLWADAEAMAPWDWRHRGR